MADKHGRTGERSALATQGIVETCELIYHKLRYREPLNDHLQFLLDERNDPLVGQLLQETGLDEPLERVGLDGEMDLLSNSQLQFPSYQLATYHIASLAENRIREPRGDRIYMRIVCDEIVYIPSNQWGEYMDAPVHTGRAKAQILSNHRANILSNSLVGIDETPIDHFQAEPIGGTSIRWPYCHVVGTARNLKPTCPRDRQASVLCWTYAVRNDPLPANPGIYHIKLRAFGHCTVHSIASQESREYHKIKDKFAEVLS